jgi:hypothetical protein
MNGAAKSTTSDRFVTHAATTPRQRLTAQTRQRLASSADTPDREVRRAPLAPGCTVAQTSGRLNERS